VRQSQGAKLIRIHGHERAKTQTGDGEGDHTLDHGDAAPGDPAFEEYLHTFHKAVHVRGPAVYLDYFGRDSPEAAKTTSRPGKEDRGA
jgi:hypothetical protein